MSSSVPEGLTDGSLARSAWETSFGGTRPVGHGIIDFSEARDFARDLAAQRGSTPGIIPHTVPYGTGFIFPRIPGISCQATFTRSLRDNYLAQKPASLSKSPQADRFLRR